MKQFLLLLFLFPVLNSAAQPIMYQKARLEEFKDRVGSCVIMGLGEAGHGYENINEAKAALVNVLHQELNFNAIAFESSFTESVISYLEKDSPLNRARNFLYPFWNTQAVNQSLSAFFIKENTAGKPLVAGFDIQEDCRYLKFSNYLSSKKIISKHLDKLNQSDSLLSFFIGKTLTPGRRLAAGEYQWLLENYEHVGSEIKEANLGALEIKLLLRCLENRKWLCKFLLLPGLDNKLFFRDSLMAENISWLKQELYPAGKLVIWGANTHISKNIKNKKPKWMGEWLNGAYPGNYFTVSFQKGNAGNRFFLKNTWYSFHERDKFDLFVYLDKLVKINEANWITPCD